MKYRILSIIYRSTRVYGFSKFIEQWTGKFLFYGKCQCLINKTSFFWGVLFCFFSVISISSSEHFQFKSINTKWSVKSALFSADFRALLLAIEHQCDRHWRQVKTLFDISHKVSISFKWVELWALLAVLSSPNPRTVFKQTDSTKTNDPSILSHPPLP